MYVCMCVCVRVYRVNPNIYIYIYIYQHESHQVVQPVSVHGELSLEPRVLAPLVRVRVQQVDQPPLVVVRQCGAERRRRLNNDTVESRLGPNRGFGLTPGILTLK